MLSTNQIAPFKRDASRWNTGFKHKVFHVNPIESIVSGPRRVRICDHFFSFESSKKNSAGHHFGFARRLCHRHYAHR